MSQVSIALMVSRECLEICPAPYSLPLSLSPEVCCSGLITLPVRQFRLLIVSESLFTWKLLSAGGQTLIRDASLLNYLNGDSDFPLYDILGNIPRNLGTIE